jgi:hypothetical protein
MSKTKELDIKIGTPQEVLWTRVSAEAKALIQQSKDNLTIQEEMLKVAEQKIELEQSKMSIKKSFK